MSASPSLGEVLDLLRSVREEAVQRYDIELVGVVGSVARGEAREDSDVDIIVRAAGRPKFRGLLALEDRLQEALHRPVDLVFSSEMRPETRTYIERDLVLL